MSLSLTRRIAQAALLVVAGAAPVVGAAGSASATALPEPKELGGLTNLDSGGLDSSLGSASHKAAGLAHGAGGEMVGSTVPSAAQATRSAGGGTLPADQGSAGRATSAAARTVGGAAGSARDGLGQVVHSVEDSDLPIGAVHKLHPPIGGIPDVHALQAQYLQTQALPTHGLLGG